MPAKGVLRASYKQRSGDKFFCDICNRQFNTATLKVLHKKVSHCDQSGVKCEICDIAFHDQR